MQQQQRLFPRRKQTFPLWSSSLRPRKPSLCGLRIQLFLHCASLNNIADNLEIFELNVTQWKEQQVGGTQEKLSRILQCFRRKKSYQEQEQEKWEFLPELVKNSIVNHYVANQIILDIDSLIKSYGTNYFDSKKNTYGARGFELGHSFDNVWITINESKLLNQIQNLHSAFLIKNEFSKNEILSILYTKYNHIILPLH